MLLLESSLGSSYVGDPVAAPINSPIRAIKIAPDQGLAVMPQVLPVHLPRYPISPPITAPAISPIR